METINALNIHNESDYSELGVVLFTKVCKDKNETSRFSSDDILGFSINKSTFSLKVKYIYNITDFLYLLDKIGSLNVCIQKNNFSYKRFIISADIAYSYNSMNNEFIELFFSVKELNYEEV